MKRIKNRMRELGSKEEKEKKREEKLLLKLLRYLKISDLAMLFIGLILKAFKSPERYFILTEYKI